MQIVIASSKKWFEIDEAISLTCDVSVVDKPEQLNLEFLKQANPDFVFFPHWNWSVPEEIFSRYTCILFHASPLPFGRGGSPIQNLILRGITETPVYAVKMVKEIDAGPLYNKRDLRLDGPLHEIFDRLNLAVNSMIADLIKSLPEPKPQKGKVVNFERLSKADNELSEGLSLTDLYDRIRMVDEPSYPNAFMEFGELAIEFFNVSKSDGKLICEVLIFDKLDEQKK
jgi:methionyl-tRNA formyltransferase